MRQKSMDTRGSAEKTVRAIRRKTRKQSIRLRRRFGS